ncbi:restriction endonuclease subunit S [Mycoplasma sp. Z244B]|uniref:restriction endonuclease subunit S n=1 Tax=Mycoplasma sp. Z244B TaxID=3401659 RepID=UPI003AAE1D0B
MQKERLVPEIRFSGYNTEWNLKTLEQIAEITFGQSPLSIYYTDKKTDHILVQGNADVKNRWVYPRIYTSQITKRAFVGDIIFSVRAPVGSVARSNYDIVIGRGVAAIKGDDFIYFNLLWKEISQFWKSKSSGSTFDSIASLELDQSEISVPSDLSEQQKIGTFFSNLDSLIQSQELKLKKLNEVRQSLLSKMFASKNQKFPEIRFKGFEEEWNINALNELINKFDNLRIPVSEKSRTKGEFPYYGANGIQDYVSGYTHDGEFVLVAEDGANDLNNYPSKYVNGKFWANNHVHVIQGKENILNNKFLSFSLKNFDFKPILTGGERTKLNASALATIEINKPFINEQQKIGQFLSSLEYLICSQELKLEKLNNIKQALLEKMFC